MSKKQQQPIDFNKATSFRTESQKNNSKYGMFTGLKPEPSMPGFNSFGNRKSKRWDKGKGNA